MFKALCLFRDQLAHIKPVEVALIGKVQFVYDSVWNEAIIEQENPDIVIGINEFHWEIAKCYEAAQKRNIPTLTLQDGILEWRFMFQNELYKGNEYGVPMHHPVLADKYACLGFNLANIIASLGNARKVEITGMPKLDKLTSSLFRKVSGEARQIKVLIITAAKPWFDESQKALVLNMLNDLKSFFLSNSQYEVTWRVTKLLDKELGVKSSFTQKDSIEIAQQINDSDLVISTTSTAIIEAMRCGKATAKIDYFNLPDLLPTVWNIFHSSQIESVLHEMVKPTPQHIWYHNYLLNMHCVNDSNSANRVSKLVLDMIEFKQKSTEELPINMIKHSDLDLTYEYPSNFYSNREVIQSKDMEWLKAKLTRLELKNRLLQKQLKRKSVGNMILVLYSKLLQKVRN